MSVDWITYKDKKILFCDFKGLNNNEDIIKSQKREVTLIEQSAEPVLLLVNLEGSTMTAESSQYMKTELARLNTKIKKIALVGVVGLKSVIVKGISTSIGSATQELFGTLDEARDWLVR